VLETCVQGEVARNERGSRTHCLSRHQMIEIMVRISILMYGNMGKKWTVKDSEAQVNDLKM
jgi:hypothetical protein